FETQKRKKNEQDTSSSVPQKIWKYNKKQNNVASSQVSESKSNKATNQRYEDYNNATPEDHENNNISSQVSLSDNESNNGIISFQVSSPDYGNNETISPHTVSSIHENNETTSPHPVTSSGHENDVSQKDDISLPIQISAQFQQADNEFEIALWVARHKGILDLATNIRNGMMTRIDDGDERQVTTLVSSMLYESILKPLEIDQ
ncbi:35508_t:CDS:2, partial [Gigaspora margarita]